MKRFATLISILLFSLCLYGCDYFGPGMADFNYNLSGGYSLYHAGSTSISKFGDSDNGIAADVKGVAWDSNFIIASQEGNSKTNYWIIDVSVNKIYGPFNEDDFNKKRNELKVDDKLKLEDPAKYKSLEKKVN